MSIQHIPNQKKRQALRKRPAPEALRFWLDLIQDVPPEQDLPDWSNADWSDTKTSGSGDPEAELFRVWEAVISLLPPLAQRYVRFDRDSLVPQHLVESHERYELLRGALGALRAIARSKGASSIELTQPAGLIGLRVNEKGEVDFTPSLVCEALQGLPASRIRECQNSACRRIFWAGRLDQPCCSRECANARRVRKWRDKYQDVYKQNRIAKQRTHEAKLGRERRGTPRRDKHPRTGR
jgi:hypothetical protein